jgi:hypothetical protein
MTKKLTAHDTEFATWQDRARQNLAVLFGESHDYTKRFSILPFRDARTTVFGGPIWSPSDQAHFERDLAMAEQILKDALGELSVVPATVTPQASTSSPKAPPSIVINVTNVLSQATSVQLSQVLGALNELELDAEQRAQAEEHAKSLDQEARGAQRWPVMAKSLEALKALGKPVYERVALPLLLDILKKQVGM